MRETTQDDLSEPCYFGPCATCGAVHGGWEPCPSDPPAGTRCTACGQRGFIENRLPGEGWTCLSCHAPYNGGAELYADFTVRITRRRNDAALHGWTYRASCTGTYTGTTVSGESPIPLWALMRAMHKIADAMHDQPPIAAGVATPTPEERPDGE